MTSLCVPLWPGEGSRQLSSTRYTSTTSPSLSSTISSWTTPASSRQSTTPVLTPCHTSQIRKAVPTPAQMRPHPPLWERAGGRAILPSPTRARRARRSPHWSRCSRPCPTTSGSALRSSTLCLNRPGSTYEFPYFERNMMADIILKTVYKHAHRRKIIFSCFDPSMCTVLRRKQPKYPVLFLSTNMAPPYATPVDLRARTIQDAMMFAKAEKLLGINLNSTPLLQDHRLVEAVTSKGLVLFTWGDDNSDFGNIELQKRLGVAAVIYDRIHHLPHSATEDRV